MGINKVSGWVNLLKDSSKDGYERLINSGLAAEPRPVYELNARNTLVQFSHAPEKQYEKH